MYLHPFLAVPRVSISVYIWPLKNPGTWTGKMPNPHKRSKHSSRKEKSRQALVCAATDFLLHSVEDAAPNFVGMCEVGFQTLAAVQTLGLLVSDTEVFEVIRQVCALVRGKRFIFTLGSDHLRVVFEGFFGKYLQWAFEEDLEVYWVDAHEGGVAEFRCSRSFTLNDGGRIHVFIVGAEEQADTEDDEPDDVDQTTIERSFVLEIRAGS
jgi:hypothetical protein